MYEITCLDEEGQSIENFYQWDKNREMTITNFGILSSPPSFHFINKNIEEVISVLSEFVDTSNKSIKVKIPNDLLIDPTPFIAYVYACDAHDVKICKTIGCLTFKVKERPKPQDYKHEDNIPEVSLESIIAEYNTQITEINQLYELNKQELLGKLEEETEASLAAIEAEYDSNVSSIRGVYGGLYNEITESNSEFKTSVEDDITEFKNSFDNRIATLQETLNYLNSEKTEEM